MLIIWQYLQKILRKTFFLWRSLASEKLQLTFEGKNRSYWENPHDLSALSEQQENNLQQQPSILFHAASGEIEHAKSVIEMAASKYPSHNILLTYSSPSTKALLKKTKGLTAVRFIPWDEEKILQTFFSELKIKAILVAKTDLWPIFLKKAASLKIPLLLFAYPSEPGAKQKKFKAKLLKYFDFIFFAADSDPRWDEVRKRIEISKLKFPKPQRKVFLAGSTWHEDDEVILQYYRKFPTQAKNWLCVIAPHEIKPDSLNKLEARFKNLGLQVQRYSQKQDFSYADVLIMDEFGILAELYPWADACFIGGSFKKQAHSVLEPLAAFKPTIVGPYFENQMAAIEFKKIYFAELPLVSVVTCAEELSQALLKIFKILQNDLSHQELQAKISLEVKKRLGGTQKVLDWLTNQLEGNRTEL